MTSRRDLTTRHRYRNDRERSARSASANSKKIFTGHHIYDRRCEREARDPRLARCPPPPPRRALAPDPVPRTSVPFPRSRRGHRLHVRACRWRRSREKSTQQAVVYRAYLISGKALHREARNVRSLVERPAPRGSMPLLHGRHARVRARARGRTRAVSRRRPECARRRRDGQYGSAAHPRRASHLACQTSVSPRSSLVRVHPRLSPPAYHKSLIPRHNPASPFPAVRVLVPWSHPYTAVFAGARERYVACTCPAPSSAIPHPPRAVFVRYRNPVPCILQSTRWLSHYCTACRYCAYERLRLRSHSCEHRGETTCTLVRQMTARVPCGCS